MSATYRVLGSMLALKQFTSKDLEAHSGVTPNSVRTTLDRRKDLVEEIGIQETNRRGGQLKRYRVRSESLDKLRKEVVELLAHIRKIPLEREIDLELESEEPKEVEPPLTLLAGEEALLYLLPEANSLEEKQTLLSTATADLETGQAELDLISQNGTQSEGAEARALMQRVSALRAVSDAELRLQRGETVLGDYYRQSVMNELSESIRYLRSNDDTARAELLERRKQNLERAWPVAAVAAAAMAASASSFVPGVPSHQIAVLPLATKRHGEEYLAYGVTQGIAGSLSLLPDVTVKRPEPVELGLTDEEIVRYGQDLGVGAVLAGRVERVGQRLHCSTRFVEMNTGRAWPEKHERSYADIFMIGEDISRTVSKILQIEVPDERMELLKKQPTWNAEAQNLYMKGRYSWSQWTASGLRRAIKFYERALDIDPKFPLAHAGLADCYNMLTYSLGESPRSAFNKAKAAAYEALESDESLCEAYTSLAYAHARYYWKWSEAENEYQQALRLNPSYTVARQWYAEFLASMGRLDEAFVQIQMARALEPNSLIARVTHGSILYFARDYESAISEFEDILKINPEFTRALFRLGGTYTQVGRLDDAIEKLLAAVGLSHRNPRELSLLSYAFALAGNRDKAREILGELRENARTHYISSYNIALVHIALQENDLAFTHLQRALEQRDPWLVFLNVDARLDPIRDLPGFQDLVDHVGFPPRPNSLNVSSSRFVRFTNSEVPEAL